VGRKAVLGIELDSGAHRPLRRVSVIQASQGKREQEVGFRRSGRDRHRRGQGLARQRRLISVQAAAGILQMPFKGCVAAGGGGH